MKSFGKRRKGSYQLPANSYQLVLPQHSHDDAADLHLVTLRNPFVGFVLPSKIHACIDSGKTILFVGSRDSDVHVLSNRVMPSGRYQRVDVGDVDGLVNALNALERAIVSERKPGVVRIGRTEGIDCIPASGRVAWNA